MATVLIADDERSIVDLLREVLEDEGHTVLVAHDGQQALTLARASAPDVVLTDQMMPHLNGLALVQMLLADPPAPHMMLMVMSATRIPKRAGLTAVTFLEKPFGLDAVVALIAAHIRS